MESEKYNKKLVLPIIVLSVLLVISLVGYIVSDKVIVDPELKELKKSLNLNDCTSNDDGEFCCNEEWKGKKLIYKECRQIDDIIQAKTEFSSQNYIQGSHLSEEMLNNEKDYCKVVTGNSMQPTLFTGNTVCMYSYESYMKSELREGMLLHYYDSGDYTVHRIKAIYKGHLIMQGDNSDSEDKISYNDIKGIVFEVIYT